MNVLAWLSLNPMEILIILGIGVILFGRKLPEVGKYLGKGIVEFKKGLKGLEDEVDPGSTAAPRQELPSLERRARRSGWWPPPPSSRIAPTT